MGILTGAGHRSGRVVMAETTPEQRAELARVEREIWPQPTYESAVLLKNAIPALLRDLAAAEATIKALEQYISELEY